ncbi:MAG: DUF2341 domain-containing protein, partial [Thermofilaceae archaeon]
MNTRVQVALILILTVLLDAVAVLQAAEAQGTWFLSGWQYRKSHVINPASGAGTNYQIRIKVNYGSGADNGENVYLNGKCRSDFGDVRFTRSDGVTLLDYWMESKVDGSYAIFWVKVADDLSTNAVTIYIYYGNPSAVTTSNIGATAILGKDWRVDQNIDGWVQSGGTITYSSDGISITQTSGAAQIRSSSTVDFSSPKRVIARFKIDTAGYYDADNYICPTVTTGDVYAEPNWIAFYQSSYVYLRKKVGGASPVIITSSTSFSGTVFHTHELRIRIGSTGYVKWFVDGSQLYSSTSESLYTSTANYLYISISAASGYTRTITQSYIAVFKFVDPEPSHGSWGSEETPPLIAQLSVAPNIVSNSLNYVNVTVCKASATISLVNVSIRVGDVIRLLWSNGSGFSKLVDPYDYCRLVVGSCSVQAVNSTAVKVTFALVLSGRMPPGQLSITATAVDASNVAAEASAQVSFTPLKPTPTSPANGSGPVAPGEALTFSWTLPQGVAQTAFELQIDDSPLFSNPLLDTGKVPSGAASYSHAVGKAGRWYWRVKVWDSFGVDTGWS